MYDELIAEFRGRAADVHGTRRLCEAIRDLRTRFLMSETELRVARHANGVLTAKRDTMMDLLARSYAVLKAHESSELFFRPFDMPRPEPGDLCSGPYRRRVEEYEKRQQLKLVVEAIEAFQREGLS